MMADGTQSGDVKENQGNVLVGSGSQTYNDNRTYHNGTPFSHEQEKLCRASYLDYVLVVNGYIRPAGVMQTYREVKLAMDDVYFHLNAAPASSGSEADLRAERELHYMEGRTDLSENERGWLRRSIMQRTAPVSTTPVKLDAAAKDNKRLVVLGEPGAGKTTLMRYLAYAHANATKKGRKNIKDIGAAKLPIYIRIGEYATAREKDKTLSLRDYLAMYYQSHNCKAERVDELFALELARGNAIVLLDGLDEITIPAERGRIVQRIEEFVSQNPGEAGGNRFVVTSRVAGYDAARMGADWAHYTIKPMERDDIQGFLEKWCPAVEEQQMGKDKKTEAHQAAEEQIKGIMQAVDNSEGVQRLATNPLMLTIITLIYKTGARLPDRRIELYHLAAETLARTWQEAKEGFDREALIKEEELADVLGPLAYCMHANRASGLVTEEEARKFIRSGLAKKRDLEESNPDDQNELEAAVDDFMLRVQVFTGLFVERGVNEENERLYSFMHLTFEEYYAARYLATRVVRQEELLKLLRRHIHDARWEEVILLTLGYIRFVMKLTDSSAEVLEKLCLDPDRPKPAYEDLFHRDLLFALRACGDSIEPRRKMLKEMVDEALEIYLAEDNDYWPAGINAVTRGQVDARIGFIGEGATKEIMSAALIEQLNDSSSDKRHIVTRFILNLKASNKLSTIKLLDIMLNDQDEHIRSFAADALSQRGEGYEAITSVLLTSMYNDESWLVRFSAAQALAKLKTGDNQIVQELKKKTQHEGRSNDGCIAAYTLIHMGQADFDEVNMLLQILNRKLGFYALHRAIHILDMIENVNGEIALRLVELLNTIGVYTEKVINTLIRIGTNNTVVIRPLMNLLKYEIDTRVKEIAISILGKIGASNNDVINTLLVILNDSKANKSLRAMSAAALLDLGDSNSSIKSFLFNSIYDQETSWIADSYGTRILAKDKWAVDQLIDHLIETKLDASMFVFVSEVVNNSSIGDERIVEILEAGLASEDNGARGAAANALSKISIPRNRKHYIIETMHKLVLEEDLDSSAEPAVYTSLYTIVSAERSRGDEEICKGLRVRDEEESETQKSRKEAENAE